MAGNGGWGFQRRDAIYAAILTLVFGGEQVIDRNRVPTPPDFAPIEQRLGRAEYDLAELRDPGGPRLRETIQRVTNLETLLAEKGKAIEVLEAGHLLDLRSGISQDTIAGLRQQITDMRTDTQELRRLIESLRGEIAHLTSARLRGPER